MSVTFGIFTDLHVDIMHDTQERLECFLEHCRRENVDFIIHAGDLTHGPSMTPEFIEFYNNFHICYNLDCHKYKIHIYFQKVCSQLT